MRSAVPFSAGVRIEICNEMFSAADFSRTPRRDALLLRRFFAAFRNDVPFSARIDRQHAIGAGLALRLVRHLAGEGEVGPGWKLLFLPIRYEDQRSRDDRAVVVRRMV